MSEDKHMTKKKVEKIYNVRGACALLSCSRSAVILWIREGHLEAFKVAGGRRWRIRESAIAAFLDNK
jgi:excisionase family DNA binding protein